MPPTPSSSTAASATSKGTFIFPSAVAAGAVNDDWQPGQRRPVPAGIARRDRSMVLQLGQVTVCVIGAYLWRSGGRPAAFLIMSRSKAAVNGRGRKRGTSESERA